MTRGSPPALRQQYYYWSSETQVPFHVGVEFMGCWKLQVALFAGVTHFQELSIHLSRQFTVFQRSSAYMICTLQPAVVSNSQEHQTLNTCLASFQAGSPGKRGSFRTHFLPALQSSLCVTESDPHCLQVQNPRSPAHGYCLPSLPPAAAVQAQTARPELQ